MSVIGNGWFRAVGVGLACLPIAAGGGSLLVLVIHALSGFAAAPPGGPSSLVLPAIAAARGSLLITTLAALIWVPVGIAAGLMVSRWDRGQLPSRVGRASILALARLPTWVGALLGLAVFVHGLGWERGELALSLTFALLGSPWMARATLRAFDNLSTGTVKACAALGCSERSALRFVLLPQALPDLVLGGLGVLLKLFGETTAVVVVLGAISMADSSGALVRLLPTLALSQLVPAEANGSVVGRSGPLLLLVVLLMVSNTIGWRLRGALAGSADE